MMIRAVVLSLAFLVSCEAKAVAGKIPTEHVNQTQLGTSQARSSLSTVKGFAMDLPASVPAVVNGIRMGMALADIETYYHQARWGSLVFCVVVVIGMAATLRPSFYAYQQKCLITALKAGAPLPATANTFGKNTWEQGFWPVAMAGYTAYSLVDRVNALLFTDYFKEVDEEVATGEKKGNGLGRWGLYKDIIGLGSMVANGWLGYTIAARGSELDMLMKAAKRA